MRFIETDYVRSAKDQRDPGSGSWIAGKSSETPEKGAVVVCFTGQQKPGSLKFKKAVSSIRLAKGRYRPLIDARGCARGCIRSLHSIATA